MELQAARQKKKKTTHDMLDSASKSRMEKREIAYKKGGFNPYHPEEDRYSESARTFQRMQFNENRAPDLMTHLFGSVTMKDVLSKPSKKPGKNLSGKLPLPQKSSSVETTGHSAAVKTRMTESGTKMDGIEKNNNIKFLNSLRKQQTDRISMELQQLEKINDIMKEVESGKYSPQMLRELMEKKSSW